MNKKYLNYKKSFEKINKIKIFDEKTGKRRSLKSKEDYRIFFNSKSKINIQLRHDLPRFPDKYYEKNENIKFDWIKWLSLGKDNYYHFKGLYKKEKIDTKIYLNSIELGNRNSLNLEKFYFELKFNLFEKFNIKSRRDWIEFYKLCKKESYAGSILSLQNFFNKKDKLSLVNFSWKDITGAKYEKISIDEDNNKLTFFNQTSNYLDYYNFKKRIRSTLKFLKKNNKIFKIENNDLNISSIKEWKKFFKKFRHVVYFHDSALTPTEVKKITSFNYNRNLIPYYPHIFYKNNFVSYANLFEISFLHENTDIVKMYTSFKHCPELIDIFLKDEINPMLEMDIKLLKIIQDELINKISKNDFSLLRGLIFFGSKSVESILNKLSTFSSNSMMNFTWICPDCGEEFQKSFKYMANKKIPLSKKHNICFSEKRINKKEKYIFTQKRNQCEICGGTEKVIDDENPYIKDKNTGKLIDNLIKCPACSS